MATAFENFVNNELPRRLAYLGGTLPAGQRLKTSGTGLLVEIDTDVVMVFKGYEETGTYPIDPKNGDVWKLDIDGDLGTNGDTVMYYEGDWIQLGGGGSSIPEPPSDGQPYVRYAGYWDQLRPTQPLDWPMENSSIPEPMVPYYTNKFGFTNISTIWNPGVPNRIGKSGPGNAAVGRFGTLPSSGKFWFYTEGFSNATGMPGQFIFLKNDSDTDGYTDVLGFNNQAYTNDPNIVAYENPVSTGEGSLPLAGVYEIPDSNTQPSIIQVDIDAKTLTIMNASYEFTFTTEKELGGRSVYAYVTTGGSAAGWITLHSSFERLPAGLLPDEDHLPLVEDSVGPVKLPVGYTTGSLLYCTSAGTYKGVTYSGPDGDGNYDGALVVADYGPTESPLIPLKRGGGGSAIALDYIDVAGPAMITGLANKSYLCDTTAGSIVISLPSEVLEDEFIEVTLKTIGEGYELTIDPAGATIEDTTDTVLIDLENTTFRFIRRDTKWLIVASGVALEPLLPQPAAPDVITLWQADHDYSGYATNDLPDIVYHPGDEETGTIPGLYFSIADHEGTEFFEASNWRSVSNGKSGSGTISGPNTFQHPIHPGDLVLIANYWEGSYIATLRGKDHEGNNTSIRIRDGFGAVIPVFEEPLASGTPNTFPAYNNAAPQGGDVVFWKDDNGITHFYYVLSESYIVVEEDIVRTWNYEEITFAGSSYEGIKSITVGTGGDYADIYSAMEDISLRFSGQTLMIELLDDIDLASPGAIQFPTFIMTVFTANNHSVGENVLAFVGGSKFNAINGTLTFTSTAKTLVSNLTDSPLGATEIVSNNGVNLESCVLASITLTKGLTGSAPGQFDLTQDCRIDNTILNDVTVISTGGVNSLGDVTQNLTDDLSSIMLYSNNGATLNAGAITINGAHNVPAVLGLSQGFIIAGAITLSGGATYTDVSNSPAEWVGKIYSPDIV